MGGSMQRFVYWIKKSLKMNWKYCSKFCVTCKFYETCKNDDVLKWGGISMNEDLIEGLFDLINDGNVDSHERAAAIALFPSLS